MAKKVELVNIRGTKENDDPFFRYKMEKVILVNNGAKLSFTNIDNISKSLGRDTKTLIKFLQKTLSIMIEYKNNMAYITKKDLTSGELQENIYKFIEKYVLCKKCSNPETYIDKSNVLCKACGFVDKN